MTIIFILEKKYTIRVHISLHVKLLIADNYETEAKTTQCNNIRIDNVPFNANSFCFANSHLPFNKRR